MMAKLQYLGVFPLACNVSSLSPCFALLLKHSCPLSWDLHPESSTQLPQWDTTERTVAHASAGTHDSHGDGKVQRAASSCAT